MKQLPSSLALRNIYFEKRCRSSRPIAVRRFLSLPFSDREKNCKRAGCLHL